MITIKLDTNNNSVFKLNYHLIMVVKYRRKVIDDTTSNGLKTIFEDIRGKYRVIVIEHEYDQYHDSILSQ